MSDLYLSSTRLVPQKGDDPFLSREEVAFQQRMLRNVQSFPQEFWTAVIQKVALDGEPVPQSQIQGLASFNVTVANAVAALETTSATAYTDLSTVGPQLTGLRNGLYIVLFGAQMNISDTTEAARVSLSINSASASNNEVLALAQSPGSGAALAISTSRASSLTLSNDNNNSVKMVYKTDSGTSCGFSLRWMLAIRYGNA